MSAIPRISDITRTSDDVRDGPNATHSRCPRAFRLATELQTDRCVALSDVTGQQGDWRLVKSLRMFNDVCRTNKKQQEAYDVHLQ